MAEATVYSLDPVLVSGGSRGRVRCVSRPELGIRYAGMPHPSRSRMMCQNRELTMIAFGCRFVGTSYLTLAAAVTTLVLLMLLVRRIIRSLRRLLSGEWYRAAAAQPERG